MLSTELDIRGRGRRILVVNSTFYPNVVGGAEMSSWLLARELTDRGYHVDALATTGYLDEGPRDALTSRRLDGIAVDLESAGTARACAVAGIPFAVIRAVTDRADDDLPDLEGVVAPDGSVHPARVVGRMASRPGDIAAWVRLVRGARAARRGLMPAVASALAGAA